MRAEYFLSAGKQFLRSFVIFEVLQCLIPYFWDKNLYRKPPRVPQSCAQTSGGEMLCSTSCLLIVSLIQHTENAVKRIWRISHLSLQQKSGFISLKSCLYSTDLNLHILIGRSDWSTVALSRNSVVCDICDICDNRSVVQHLNEEEIQRL